MFKAEVILASKNTFGQRITTMLVTFPRYILAELNTHRMLSKNSASSRAIPFKKMVQSVEENPFIPIAWMKDHKGMQGTEYLSKMPDIGSSSPFQFKSPHEQATAMWLLARNNAVQNAIYLHSIGVTKQMCNRLLEPYAWHTVLITATEWENFFALRHNPLADIHMQELARLMLEAYNDAYVQPLDPGQWHIPFFTWADVYGDKTKVKEMENHLVKVSTARCAQTSYIVVGEDGKPMDHEKLLYLYEEKLLKPKHMSPFEHCAKAMEEDEFFQNSRWGTMELCPIIWEDAKEGTHVLIEHNDSLKSTPNNFGWCKNFRGFLQHRAMIEGENQSDSRVKH